MVFFINPASRVPLLIIAPEILICESSGRSQSGSAVYCKIVKRSSAPQECTGVCKNDIAVAGIKSAIIVISPGKITAVYC